MRASHRTRKSEGFPLRQPKRPRVPCQQPCARIRPFKLGEGKKVDLLARENAFVGQVHAHLRDIFPQQHRFKQGAQVLQIAHRRFHVVLRRGPCEHGLRALVQHQKQGSVLHRLHAVVQVEYRLVERLAQGLNDLVLSLSAHRLVQLQASDDAERSKSEKTATSAASVRLFI